jgi:F-type H+-transporting ATPase subunit b
MSWLTRFKTTAGIWAGIFWLALLTAAPAFAQEEATQPENTTAGWIFRWLNFAVVFIAIVWVLVTKARPAFRAHADAIQAAIAEGTRAREEAEQRRQEAERKLAGIEQEITAMRLQAKRDAEIETDRIRSLAREEAIKVDRAAEAEIAAAERAARFELKATAARLAIERAEAQLREQLTPPEDSQLVRNFVGDLAGSQN